MTEQDALLAAIIASPECDTSRLVYADWLDEHGQPEWAEFIRMQIATLEKRCLNGSRLWGAAHASDAWFAAVCKSLRLDWDFWNNQTALKPRQPDPNILTTEFLVTRGFVEEVCCSAMRWFARADALTATHPIRRVRLTTLPAGQWSALQKRGEATYRYAFHRRTVTESRVREQREKDGVWDDLPDTPAHIFRAFWPTIEMEILSRAD